jgi:hypothetical protein
LSEDSGITIEKASESIPNVLLRSGKALGSGYADKMKYIMHVPSSTFDSAKTKEMAEDIYRLNEEMKKSGDNYLLIGPGRWGSSDPWLGIPVLWNQISESRMIVETAIPGYQIEPSQGTHFFQNITSLGIGYLTIDTVRGDGYVNEDALSKLNCVYKGEFVRLYEAPDGMTAFIDRSSNKSIVGY